MLTRLMTASSLAGGFLMVMLQAPAQALPAAKTDAVNSSTVTLVGNRGPGGGGGGGFKMGGGGGGFKMGGGGGAPRFSQGGGGGSRFSQGGGGTPRFSQRGGNRPQFSQNGGGVPRFANRGDGGRKAWQGRKLAGDFNHHNKGHRGHRKFRGFAFYGAPYVYAYSAYGSCDWLYRRAIATGSPYWWNRYYACRDGYYDY